MKLRDLMEAAYKFLQQDQSVFRELWDWSVCVPLLRSHDTLVRWSVAVGLFSRFKCGDGRGSVEFCASGGKGSYVKCVIFILVPLGFLLPFLNHVSLTWKMR